MPSIYIDNPTGSFDFVRVPDRMNKWDYTDCEVTLVDPANPDYCAEKVPSGVKVRGNYTANYDKKPLRFKFPEKQGMFGLNGGSKLKSWVLLADVKDSSLHRNALSFLLGKTLLGEDGYYSSDCLPVEVYINQSYWGVYLLAEQQQVNKKRINISEPEADYQGTDIGYFFEFDGYASEEPPVEQGGDPTFTINYSGRSWQNGYTVKSDITSDNQLNFIKNYLQNAYKICYEARRGTYYSFSEDYQTLNRVSATDAKSHISSIIDLPSLVDMYILHEIACDADIGWSSFYLDVDFAEKADHLLRFEAPWDFDSGFGIKNGTCEDAQGNFAGTQGNPWLALLSQDSWFVDLVKQRWSKFVSAGYVDYLFDYIDAADAAYSEQYNHNFQKWNHLGGNYMGTRAELRSEVVNCETHQDESDFLKDWLADRLTFVNSEFGDGSPVNFHKPIDERNDALIDTVRLEAEEATVTGNARKRTGNNASKNGYLGGLDGNKGVKIAFSYNCSSDNLEGLVRFGVAKQKNRRALGEMFILKVNGQEIDIRGAINPRPTTNDPFHDWGNIPAAWVPLKQGANSIEITTRRSSTNFDYIDIDLAETA